MDKWIIEVSGLVRQFGHKAALDQVDLRVPPGVVFGLVGENGAGKTTLIKHLLGLLAAQRGTVRVFGRDPVAEPARVLQQIGYLSEERDLPAWMRVGELIRYTAAFFADWDAPLAEQLLETFGLPTGQRVHQLSRGQRARVGLLLAVAHRPRLLLLDEPSSGLDPLVRRDIVSAIVRTVADEGRTVLFSSHLLDEVQRVADRVAMLHQGRVVLCDDLDPLLESHHRLTLQFSTPQKTPPTLPGALSITGDGQLWSCVCNGQHEQLRQSAEAQGAAVLEVSRPSLEEIFVARAEEHTRSDEFVVGSAKP